MSRNLARQHFGRLIALEPIGKNKSGLVLWKCTCTCGNTVEVASHSLISGCTMSCGCYRIQSIKRNNTKHGMRQTRFYRIWAGMKTRCFNPNVIEYKNYGGRGIDVCDKWLNFKGFYDDMHETYTAHVNACGEENTTLERIENNLGYSPDNCIWASIKEQNNNSRNNRIIEFRGRIMNLSLDLQMKSLRDMSSGLVQKGKCLWEEKKEMPLSVRF